MKTDSKTLNERALAVPVFAAHARGLTKSDALIANYIADNLDKVIQMTISELAGETAISEITISRFCRKLDLPGFQALKVQLAALSSPAVVDLEVRGEDDTRTLALKIFRNITEALSITQNTLDYAALDRAAEFIAAADRLMVFGYGTSGTICRDIGIRFVRFGIPAETLTDPHQQATVAGTCSEKYRTVVVLVSLSGSSVDLIQSVKLARERGAKIILITSHRRSPLAMLADEILIGMGPEIRLLVESTTTRFAYLAIVDVLFTRIAILKGAGYQENAALMRRALAPFKS